MSRRNETAKPSGYPNSQAAPPWKSHSGPLRLRRGACYQQRALVISSHSSNCILNPQYGELYLFQVADSPVNRIEIGMPNSFV